MTYVPPCGHHECRELTACCKPKVHVIVPKEYGEVKYYPVGHPYWPLPEQVDLPEDATKILHDNLWDLYMTDLPKEEEK